MYKYSITIKSTNKKTGPIPVTTSPKQTCPSNCSLKGDVCYASLGPLGLHWNKLSNGTRGVTYDEMISTIKDLPDGIMWRHNQAGDLVGQKSKPYNIKISSLMNMIYSANLNKKGFTYTHYKMNKQNKMLVKEANDNGFTINLSADSIKQADELYKHRVAPVCVVLPHDASKTKKIITPDGNTVIPCPHDATGIQCITCKLCAVPTRKTIIGFIAHGTRKRNFKDVT